MVAAKGNVDKAVPDAAAILGEVAWRVWNPLAPLVNKPSSGNKLYNLPIPPFNKSKDYVSPFERKHGKKQK